MKISTSKDREVEKQPNVSEPYQHPPAIQGHVYMITRSKIDRLKGAKYHAVLDNTADEVRLYSLHRGDSWSHHSAFGVSGGFFSTDEWVDITDKVYLNTDELDE
ncbi:MAG: hypothetical protein GY820_48320 [Gammaproteobacteria bacterium]|nr:hypothetical protein [Gammaproteobacteria bacterium]